MRQIKRKKNQPIDLIQPKQSLKENQSTEKTNVKNLARNSINGKEINKKNEGEWR